MSRRKNQLPSYRRHNKNPDSPGYKRAIVTLRDAVTGERKDFMLGEYDTPASHREYERVTAAWIANGRRLVRDANDTEQISVNELILEYVTYAADYYQKDRQPTSELERVKRSLRPVRELYGHMPAVQFGPMALRAIREQMIEKGWSRHTVNTCVSCIKRCFKWAVGRELIPPAVHQALACVEGLRKGRSKAKESGKIQPVADEVVEATLPYLSKTIRAMVQVQRLTGMRAGEVCLMRPCDIDRGGDIWIYRPASHKTAYHGHDTAILLGPRAQAVLQPFLFRDATAYCFSPREAVANRHAEMRANRKSPVQPSQQCRKVENPKRPPRDRYDTCGYGRAIARAIKMANTARACEKCKKLNPANRCEECKAVEIPSWHSHQLRHANATEVRAKFGLDHARAVLRHQSTDVTEVYAERDKNLAVEVAAQLG